MQLHFCSSVRETPLGKGCDNRPSLPPPRGWGKKELAFPTLQPLTAVGRLLP